MSRWLIGLGAVLLGGGLLALSRTLGSRSDDLMTPQEAPSNPLPPCPSLPNCTRTSRIFAEDAGALFQRAEDALRAVAPAELYVRASEQRIDAVFQVFVFSDDLTLVVEPYEAGSVVHVRSASRVGRSDLGVNRRRVDRLLRALNP